MLKMGALKFHLIFSNCPFVHNCPVKQQIAELSQGSALLNGMCLIAHSLGQVRHEITI